MCIALYHFIEQFSMYILLIHEFFLLPSTQFVEKKTIFFVSSGLSWENSGVRGWGSDSPVSEELST